MPRVRESRYAVYHTLQELSKEGDHFAEDFPTTDETAAWFESVKEVFTQLRDSTNVKDIDYPPEISTLFPQDRKNRPVEEDAVESQKERVHNSKHVKVANKKKSVAEEGAQIKKISENVPNSKTPAHKIREESLKENLEVCIANSNEIFTASQNQCVPITLKTNLIKSFHKSNNLNVVNNVSIECVHTPVMDKNSKIIGNSSIILDGSIKINVNITHLQDGIVTRSGSKRKSPDSRKGSNKKRKEKDSKEVQTAAIKSPYPKLSREAIITRSSGSKQKSSVRKDSLSKKRELKSSKTETSSATKSASSKHPVEKPVFTKIGSTSKRENKKNLSVITPPQLSRPAISKKKQILQEIKKRRMKTSKKL